jgi:hypothetical protein
MLTNQKVMEMNYRELQAQAKVMGIKANQSADILRSLVIARIDTTALESVLGTVAADEFDKFMDGDNFTESAVVNPDNDINNNKENDVEMKKPAFDLSVRSEFVYVPYTFAWDEQPEPEEELIQYVAPLPGQTTFAKALDKLITVANGASEASAPVQSATTNQNAKENVNMEQPSASKLFEFIESTNLTVAFRQKDKLVRIGWSVSTARPYIQVDGQPARVQMIQTSIDAFKKFVNGKHGDVARIVKALVRIRKMPAAVNAQLHQRKRAANEVSSELVISSQRQQQNVSVVDRKENQSKARYSGTINASWLAQFRTEFESNEGRKPTGLEIRDAWLSREA